MENKVKPNGKATISAGGTLRYHARYVREDGHNILTVTKRLPDGWSTDLEGAR